MTSLYTNQQLAKQLTELNVITDDVLKTSLKEAEKNKQPLGDVLLSKNAIARKDLTRLISDLIQVPSVFLNEQPIKLEILQTIPEVVAKKQQAIVFEKNKEGLSVAMADPKNIVFKDFLAKKTGLKVKAYFALPQDISDSIRLYAKDVKSAFSEIIDSYIKEAQTNKAADPPIIKIVDTIITYAYQNRASDIHIEPLDDNTLVRFRIDGLLHDIVTFENELHNRIILRLKVMAKLQTDEHQAAQDGKLQFNIDHEQLDLRISIVPITNGEKVVMRLLSDRARQYSLQDLGMKQHDLDIVSQAYQKPYGMILSTGPTGSGKTTTLYSILKLLNKRGVNIMTIEDPVEYDMDSVNQIQVNTKTELTFAKGLRSIVRQDPDIILVGEIRDDETADIAINSAMTGHLVLSTLHTNDAATTFPRLIDMGVEPYLVASTVSVVVAQRLVRKLCSNCRFSISTDDYFKKNPAEKELLEKELAGTSTLYGSKGCPVCHQSGYDGRLGVFEVIFVNEPVREAITNSQNADQIRQVAIKHGMISMFDDGISKAKEGLTSLEEVMRVTKDSNE